MAYKTLVIDGQMFQTGAWHRGMGQYMLHLLEEYVKLQDSRPLTIIFNSNLELDKNRIEKLKEICPNMKQLVLDLPLPPKGKTGVKAEQQYKTTLAEQLKKSVDNNLGNIEFLITSPFTFDFFALFPDSVTKLLMFYDLIPLLQWRDLGGYFPPELYMQRFKQIFDADLIFAISETTKNDLLDVFALANDKVVNIDGGFSGFSGKPAKPKFSVPKQYILLPTADLPHKNNEVAVRGFREFCKTTGWQGKLLVTSTFSEATQLSLAAETKNIQFTGNVPVEELHWLYKNAEAVIFPSKYEGLGIPLLDAVASNLPALASKIPVFLEMTKNGYYYFDPNNPSDLARQLQKSFTAGDFIKKQAHYAAILKKYTWNETAKKFAKGLSQSQKTLAVQTSAANERIAIVSMHPGCGTARIGQVSEKLYIALRHHYKIDFYLDTNAAHPKDLERPTFLDQQDCSVFDINRLTITAYKKYHKVIYLLDDASWHRAAQRAAILPGYVVYKQGDKTLQWQTVLKNQHAKIELKGSDYVSMGEIKKWIKKVAPSADLTQKVALLKSSRSPRSIIKQLMEQVR